MTDNDQHLIWEAYTNQINRIQFLNEMSTGSYDDIVLMYEAGFFKNVGNKLKKGAQLGAVGAAGLASALGPTAKANTNDMSSANDTWNKTERMFNTQQDKDDKAFKKRAGSMQKNTDEIDQLDVSPDSANDFSSLKKGEELEDEWTGFVDRLIDGYSRAVQQYHSGKIKKGMSLDDIANNWRQLAIEFYGRTFKKDINDNPDALKMLDDIFSDQKAPSTDNNTQSDNSTQSAKAMYQDDYNKVVNYLNKARQDVQAGKKSPEEYKVLHGRLAKYLNDRHIQLFGQPPVGSGR